MTPAEPAASEGRWRLATAVAAGAACALFALLHQQVKAADFYVFWAAARHATAPYDPRVVATLATAYHITGALPFVYPPTFLLFVRPFAALPLDVAFPIWTGLSAGLFFFAAAHLVRPAWASLALLITPPVVLAIAPGQTSLIVGAAMIGGFQLRQTRPALAGALFAIAAAIKPQAMILAPVVLFGDWRLLRWAATIGASLAIASFAFGPGLWLEWPRALAGFAGVVPETNRINPSALFASPLWAAATALLGLLIAWRWRDLAGLVGGALCVTPYAHQYDLAPLAPLALAWLIEARRQGLGRAASGAGLLAGLVATPLLGLGLAAALAIIAKPLGRIGAAAAPEPAPP